MVSTWNKVKWLNVTIIIAIIVALIMFIFK